MAFVLQISGIKTELCRSDGVSAAGVLFVLVLAVARVTERMREVVSFTGR